MPACECKFNGVAALVCALFVSIIISLIILFIVIVLYDNFYLKYNKYEAFENNGAQSNPVKGKKWLRAKNCKYAVSSTIAKVLEEYGIDETTDGNFHMYLPCNYNDIKGEIYNINTKNTCSDEMYFIVSNADELTGKDRLWRHLKQLYGDNATQIMPQTYVLYDQDDVEQFNNDYDPNKIYILKKNIQRQEGLKITNNKNEILNALNKDKYVLVQELLQDPFIIDGRKTNMRFYLLLVCNNGQINAYVHNEGFMYYTAEPFVAGSTDHKVNITTGYIDRAVYEKNPLTLGDLREYIDLNLNNVTNSTIVFNRILEVINKLTDAVGFSVCQDNSLFRCNTFQIFGVDVALNDQLMPQIMEVNKGPDLGGKDERDLNIKKKVVADMFNIVGIIPNVKDNSFRQVYPEIEYF
jgi:hypothetical protein